MYTIYHLNFFPAFSVCVCRFLFFLRRDLFSPDFFLNDGQIMTFESQLLQYDENIITRNYLNRVMLYVQHDPRITFFLRSQKPNLPSSFLGLRQNRSCACQSQGVDDG